MAFPIERGSQRSVLGAAVTFGILPVIAVCLRISASRIARRSLNSSDWCIIAAAIFTVVLESISITLVLKCGLGLHVTEIVLSRGSSPITELSKLLIPLQILWALSLGLCKISILLLYSKIFSVPLFIWLARGTAGFVLVGAIATILAAFLICTPFQYNWDKTIEGKCGDQVLSFLVTGVINVVTDVAVLMLPLPYLYRLNLPRNHKVVMIGVFSVGFLTCVVSAVRIHFLSSMDYADITFTISNANIFSGMEPGVAVTLACIPLLRPLLTAIRGGSYSTTGTVRFGSAQQKTGSIELKSHRKGILPDNDSFVPLGDDSSEYRLRPDTIQHQARVAGSPNFLEDSEGESDDRSCARDGVRSSSRQITIRKDWEVSSVSEERGVSE